MRRVLNPDDRRLVVVGTSGSGKTTFSRALSGKLGIPHVELDALYWGPNWTGRSKAEFQAAVLHRLKPPAWIVDGNYSKVSDLVWERATTIIWLDYPFRVVFGRALSRTFRRLITREELYSGNRETWRNVLHPEGIPIWVLRTYRRRRREYPARFRETRYSHLHVVVLRSPSEADRLLARIPPGNPDLNHSTEGP